MVGLKKKTATFTKISPKMVHPRDIAGERRKRRIPCCLHHIMEGGKAVYDHIRITTIMERQSCQVHFSYSSIFIMLKGKMCIKCLQEYWCHFFQDCQGQHWLRRWCFCLFLLVSCHFLLLWLLLFYRNTIHAVTSNQNVRWLFSTMSLVKIIITSVCADLYDLKDLTNM